jgi:hypothetical protein
MLELLITSFVVAWAVSASETSFSVNDDLFAFPQVGIRLRHLWQH